MKALRIFNNICISIVYMILPMIISLFLTVAAIQNGDPAQATGSVLGSTVFIIWGIIALRRVWGIDRDRPSRVLLD